MTAAAQAILDRVNANNWAVLYRSRWSPHDEERVVPQRAKLLESENCQIINEALGALFVIGTHAASAAPRVAKLIRSQDQATKRLAVLTLGQIAHKRPALCVEPLASTLSDPLCCRDAMRSLAYIGSKANGALERVKQLFSDPDAKVRKAAVVTATAISVDPLDIMKLLRKASADRSKIVREAARKCLQNVKTS